MAVNNTLTTRHNYLEPPRHTRVCDNITGAYLARDDKIRNEGDRSTVAGNAPTKIIVLGTHIYFGDGYEIILFLPFLFPAQMQVSPGGLGNKPSTRAERMRAGDQRCRKGRRSGRAKNSRSGFCG